MKIKKVTKGKGEWIIRIDKQMYKHLQLIPGFEYVWIILEEDGSLRIRRVEEVSKIANKEVGKDG